MPRRLCRRILEAVWVAGLLGAVGCSGSANPVGDTGEITGSAVEERIFTPIEGAQVEIGGQTSTTGAAGAFTVSGVPQGEQRLAITAAGYLAFSTTVLVEPGPQDVGQLWLKRAQTDGGTADGGAVDGGGQDGGVGDGPTVDGTPLDGAPQDVGRSDVMQDVGQSDVMQDVGQSDVMHDVGQSDVMQDVGQSDVMQDVGQSDVMQDVGQSDVMHDVLHDSAAARLCGTLGLTANPIWPGTPVGSATFTGASLTAPHAPTPCAAGGAGAEHVYWYHHDHVADLVFEATQSNWNVVAYIRADCDGLDGGGNPIADAVCADRSGSIEQAVWPAAPAGDYYFFVDGVTASDIGAYQAKLSLREIHGEGEYCDGITARCQAGLTCQLNQCYTLAAWCGSRAVGTLQEGVPADGNTTSATNALQCDSVGHDREQFWAFTADATGGLYSVRVTSPDHDLYIYSTADCTDPAASVNCSGSMTRDVSYDLLLGAAEGTYLVVDGYTGSFGAYTITVDKVQLLDLGAVCDPQQLRLARCAADAYCDETSHCAAVVVESEDNDSAPNADPVTSGQPITGAKSTGTDVDWFSITAAAGDVIVAETLDGATSRCAQNDLDSRLRVFAETDLVNPLASNDDALGNFCSFVIAPVAVGGTFYVVLDYFNGGTGTFDYTLRVWVRSPAVVPEAPSVNDDAAAAQGVALPIYLDGALDPLDATTPDVVDWVKFAAPQGYRLFAHAFDAAGTVCALPNDRLALVAPDGSTVIDSTAFHCDLAHAGGLSTGGTYYARIAAGTPAAFSYRLLVFSLPW